MKRIVIFLALVFSSYVPVLAQQFKVIDCSDKKDCTSYIRFENDSAMISLIKNNISILNVQEYWEEHGITRYVLYNKEQVFNVRLVKKTHSKYVMFYWNNNFSKTYNLKLER
jgi:hypothetical protein